MKKYEITKETIVKYKMKDEFPEVFEVKLEVGKWYKNDQNAIFFTCNVNDKKPYGYGITAGKVFVEDDNFAAWSVSGIELATKQEVFEALKKEAIKREIKVGAYVSRTQEMLNLNDTHRAELNVQICKNLFDYSETKNSLSIDGRVVFINGTWATIIPTKTKEEAEKLLNCKILN